jgi:protein-disulfide isomerase
VVPSPHYQDPLLPRNRIVQIGVEVVSGGAMTSPTVPTHVPAVATPEGDGVIVGDGPVRVDVFVDFLCPFCRRFELSAALVLSGLVADHLVSLVYHPMNFLDEVSTTKYSTRAAAASGCAADQGRFVQYSHALFVSQPPEEGPGLSDAELAQIGRGVGMTEAALAACLGDAPYLDWPAYVTARATAVGVTATPTVLVAGAVVAPDPRAISRAVGRASRTQ